MNLLPKCAAMRFMDGIIQKTETIRGRIGPDLKIPTEAIFS